MAISLLFLETENMEVPIDREISLDKAILLLDKQNIIAKNDSIAMQFSYGLYENGQEVYQSMCELPQESFDLFNQIVQEINEQPFEEEAQKQAFLSWLSQVFHRKIKEPKKEKIVTQKKELTSEKKPKVKKERKIRTNNFPMKKVLIGLILFAFLMVIGGGVYLAMNQSESPTSLETLIKEEKYMEAGKEYPKETTTIENELFLLVRTKDKSYLDQLKQFNKNYPTIQGNFDLAMFDYDYQRALSFYTKNSSEFEQDNERLALVGYAYLKTDAIDDAKNLLKKSNDAELEKLILQYEQAQRIIAEKQKEIEELQKKPTENKVKIEQAIEELFQAQKKLSQI